MDIDQRINQRADQAALKAIAEAQAQDARRYRRTTQAYRTIQQGGKWLRIPINEEEGLRYRTVRQQGSWRRQAY